MVAFTKILIIGNQKLNKIKEQIEKLALDLEELGCKVFIENNEFGPQISLRPKPLLKRKWLKEIELAIVVGGDGTMLAASRQLVNFNIPMVGINQGKLGFMTDIAINDMLGVVHSLVDLGEYKAEERTLISGEIFRKNKLEFESLALNDIVISRGAVGSMIEFEISINEEFVHSQKSDGVIFATPTGSTAYSLAAGGPILHPQSGVLAIVPICPQSMSNRPIVINNNCEITLTIVKDTPSFIHFDGQDYLELEFNDKVLIKKAQNPLRLFHPIKYSYYNTLRTKLDWSKRVS